eukprot:PhM_4_TR18649/c2_g4_i5/m.23160
MTPCCKTVGFIALLVLVAIFHASTKAHFASDPSLYLTPDVQLKEVVDSVIEETSQPISSTQYEHKTNDSSDIRNNSTDLTDSSNLTYVNSALRRVSSLLRLSHVNLSTEHIANESSFPKSSQDSVY